MGDGIDINSRNFTHSPKYNQSRNINIRNSVFDMNGRNNISITDGEDIVVENNDILNAGVVNDQYPNAATNGPWAGIDIEGARRRDPNSGAFLFDEYPNRITIRNNIEKGSRGSGLLIFIGYDSIIEDNVTEQKISILKGTGNIIRRNTITAVPGADTSVSGITLGSVDTRANANNRAYENTITGFTTGVSVSSVGSKLYDNDIFDFSRTGILLKSYVSDAEIYGNNLRSSLPGTEGVFLQVAELDDVAIHSNEIDVASNGIKISNVNQQDSQLNLEYSIYNNDVSPGSAQSAIIGASSNGQSANLNLYGNTLQGATTGGIIRLSGFRNATIRDNVGDIGSATPFVRFDGSNSFFKNNKTISGETRNQITGSGNTIEID